MTAVAFLAPIQPRRFAEPEPGADDLADAVTTEEAKLRRSFLAAVASMLLLFDDADTRSNVPSGLVYDLVRELDRVLTDRGQPALLAAFVQGATFAAERLPVASVGLTFNLVNQRAVDWAARQSATMVTLVGDETRRAIRAIITRAVRDGLSPAQVARQIRALIGLTERDALAVGNLQTTLLEEGRKPGQVERMVSRYANRLLRRRAETIARTEIMTAANRGQEALWSQAVADGLLSESDWERMWLVAKDERTCKVCKPLDRKRAPMLGGTFPGGVAGPPVHPRCRCTTGLVEKRGAA